MAIDSVKALSAQMLGRGSAAGDAVAAENPALDPLSLVESALNATDGKVMLTVLENRSVVAIMGVAATNQGYETWEAADRRSLILKNGVLTASRGLGDDLMSSNSDETLALLLAGDEGRATRSYQFLTGLGETSTLNVECEITQGGDDRVQGGEIDVAAKTFAEICTSGPLKIQNLFWVDANGNILKSRQWVSAGVGYALFLHLRQ